MAMPDLVAREVKVYIYTLGKFYIREGNSVISESSSRSKRMWEVFKYLLSNRDKSFLPETILDNIWPEKDYADPNTVMRAQMFRLRQALGTDVPEKSLTANIVFSQGSYHWENNIDCWIDVDEFEKMVGKASMLAGDNPEAAIELYQNALELYKGEYLPESSFSEWIVPVRTYYHDLFLSSLFELVELLKGMRAHDQIIRACEKAAAIDYFEEGIHIRLIEALLAKGLTKRARAHYNEVTSTFYREMGVKPSDEMKKLYRMVGLETGTFELDLSTIQEGMKSKEKISGPYMCDAEMFRYFYKLEQLRGERSDIAVLLCLLTLVAPDHSRPPKSLLKSVMLNLQDVIMSSLRKGDLVTRWNEAQYLLMLPNLNREQALKVMQRIENDYIRKHSLQGLILQKKVETLFPLEGDSHFN
jgi:DNA-binding SARP family transcriptional activator